MTVFVFLAFFLSLLVGSLFRPIYGVIGYLSTYFLFNPVTVWWGQKFAWYVPRPSFLVMAFFVVGCLLQINRLNWTFTRREIELYLFLIVAWMVSLTVGIGMNPNSWMYLEKLSKMFLFIFLFIRVVSSLESYRAVVWTFILCAVFLIFQAHMIGGYSEGRLNNIGGTDFGEANGFAAYLSVAVCMLGLKILDSPFWRMLIYILAIAGLCDTIILTQSRSVFMGIVAASIFVFFIYKGERKKIFVYLCLGVVLFSLLSDKSYWRRMATINTKVDKVDTLFNSNLKEVPLNRIEFWKDSLLIFKDHPWGIGVMNFAVLVHSYDPRNPGRDPHNTYVLCYTEIGIVGIVLFLIILLEAFLQIRRLLIVTREAALLKELMVHAITIGSCLSIYVFGLMLTHSVLYMEITWILLAMPICLENIAKNLVSGNP